MKKRKLILLISAGMALVMLLAACSSPAGNESGPASEAMGGVYEKITPEQAKEKMDKGGVTILDVRTAEEYAEGHIEGALNLPNEEIGEKEPEQLEDKDAEILIYCRSGNRSRQAAEKLIAMGYTRVYDFGGINDWPYDVVAGGEESGRESGEEEKKDGVFSEFTAEDLDGNEQTQEIFSGKKLTMVNIWGTFCGPCISEMPELAELNEAYDESEFQVVGMVIDILGRDGTVSPEGIETAKYIIEQTGADYLHLTPSQDLIEKKLQYVDAVPETIFVDENGVQVGESYKGARSKEKWQEIIDELLTKV